MKDPALVPFTPDLAPLVAGWATTPQDLDRWASRRDVPLDPAVLAVWHEDPDVDAWMLSWQGESVAYGEVWWDHEQGEAELARLIVAPDRRGRGLGRALVLGLVAEARGAGFPRVVVRVVPDNTPALACYAAAGFVRAQPDDEAAFNAGQPRAYIWMLALPERR